MRQPGLWCWAALPGHAPGRQHSSGSLSCWRSGQEAPSAGVPGSLERSGQGAWSAAPQALPCRPSGCATHLVVPTPCCAVANVFLGNLLVLPTTILWLEFMDGVGLFPAPAAKIPNTC